MRVTERRIELCRGPAYDPDAIVSTDAGTLSTVLWQGRDLDDALRAGELRIDGDVRSVRRFVTLFPQPAPIAAAT